MTPETLFTIGSYAVLPGWALLVFFPAWRWSNRFVAPLVVPALLALAYGAVLLARFGASEGGFGSLAQVQALFSDPWLLVAGWLHYLAFDLFVGAWEVRDALRLGIRHWLVVPCLLLTFLFGPVGLLAYLVVRVGLRRELAVGVPTPASALASTPASPTATGIA